MRILTALLFSAAVIVAGSGKSFASDADDVKAATQALHAAIASLDTSKMDPLWAHDATVTLINPANKSISVGWDGVRKTWEAQNAYLSALKITQLDGPYIQVKGDVAWQTGLSTSDATLKSGVSRSRPVVDVTVFEKRDGAWLVVSHTAQWTPQ